MGGASGLVIVTIMGSYAALGEAMGFTPEMNKFLFCFWVVFVMSRSIAHELSFSRKYNLWLMPHSANVSPMLFCFF